MIKEDDEIPTWNAEDPGVLPSSGVVKEDQAPNDKAVSSADAPTRPIPKKRYRSVKTEPADTAHVQAPYKRPRRVQRTAVKKEAKSEPHEDAPSTVPNGGVPSKANGETAANNFNAPHSGSRKTPWTAPNGRVSIKVNPDAAADGDLNVPRRGKSRRTLSTVPNGRVAIKANPETATNDILHAPHKGRSRKTPRTVSNGHVPIKANPDAVANEDPNAPRRGKRRKTRRTVSNGRVPIKMDPEIAAEDDLNVPRRGRSKKTRWTAPKGGVPIKMNPEAEADDNDLNAPQIGRSRRTLQGAHSEKWNAAAVGAPSYAGYLASAVASADVSRKMTKDEEDAPSASLAHANASMPRGITADASRKTIKYEEDALSASLARANASMPRGINSESRRKATKDEEDAPSASLAHVTASVPHGIVDADVSRKISTEEKVVPSASLAYVNASGPHGIVGPPALANASALGDVHRKTDNSDKTPDNTNIRVDDEKKKKSDAINTLNDARNSTEHAKNTVEDTKKSRTSDRKKRTDDKTNTTDDTNNRVNSEKNMAVEKKPDDAHSTADNASEQQGKRKTLLKKRPARKIDPKITTTREGDGNEQEPVAEEAIQRMKPPHLTSEVLRTVKNGSHKEARMTRARRILQEANAIAFGEGYDDTVLPWTDAVTVRRGGRGARERERCAVKEVNIESTETTAERCASRSACNGDGANADQRGESGRREVEGRPTGTESDPKVPRTSRDNGEPKIPRTRGNSGEREVCGSMPSSIEQEVPRTRKNHEPDVRKSASVSASVAKSAASVIKVEQPLAAHDSVASASSRPKTLQMVTTDDVAWKESESKVPRRSSNGGEPEVPQRTVRNNGESEAPQRKKNSEPEATNPACGSTPVVKPEASASKIAQPPLRDPATTGSTRLTSLQVATNDSAMDEVKNEGDNFADGANSRQRVLRDGDRGHISRERLRSRSVSPRGNTAENRTRTMRGPVASQYTVCNIEITREDVLLNTVTCARVASSSGEVPVALKTPKMDGAPPATPVVGNAPQPSGDVTPSAVSVVEDAPPAPESESTPSAVSVVADAPPTPESEVTPPAASVGEDASPPPKSEGTSSAAPVEKDAPASPESEVTPPAASVGEDASPPPKSEGTLSAAPVEEDAPPATGSKVTPPSTSVGEDASPPPKCEGTPSAVSVVEDAPPAPESEVTPPAASVGEDAPPPPKSECASSAAPVEEDAPPATVSKVTPAPARVEEDASPASACEATSPGAPVRDGSPRAIASKVAPLVERAGGGAPPVPTGQVTSPTALAVETVPPATLDRVTQPMASVLEGAPSSSLGDIAQSKAIEKEIMHSTVSVKQAVVCAGLNTKVAPPVAPAINITSPVTHKIKAAISRAPLSKVAPPDPISADSSDTILITKRQDVPQAFCVKDNAAAAAKDTKGAWVDVKCTGENPATSRGRWENPGTVNGEAEYASGARCTAEGASTTHDIREGTLPAQSTKAEPPAAQGASEGAPTDLIMANGAWGQSPAVRSAREELQLAKGARGGSVAINDTNGDAASPNETMGGAPAIRNAREDVPAAQYRRKEPAAAQSARKGTEANIYTGRGATAVSVAMEIAPVTQGAGKDAPETQGTMVDTPLALGVRENAPAAQGVMEGAPMAQRESGDPGAVEAAREDAALDARGGPVAEESTTDEDARSAPCGREEAPPAPIPREGQAAAKGGGEDSVSSKQTGRDATVAASRTGDALAATSRREGAVAGKGCWGEAHVSKDAREGAQVTPGAREDPVAVKGTRDGAQAVQGAMEGPAVVNRARGGPEPIKFTGEDAPAVKGQPEDPGLAKCGKEDGPAAQGARGDAQSAQCARGNAVAAQDLSGNAPSALAGWEEAQVLLGRWKNATAARGWKDGPVSTKCTNAGATSAKGPRGYPRATKGAREDTSLVQGAKQGIVTAEVGRENATASHGARGKAQPAKGARGYRVSAQGTRGEIQTQSGRVAGGTEISACTQKRSTPKKRPGETTPPHAQSKRRKVNPANSRSLSTKDNTTTADLTSGAHVRRPDPCAVITNASTVRKNTETSATQKRGRPKDAVTPRAARIIASSNTNYIAPLDVGSVTVSPTTPTPCPPCIIHQGAIRKRRLAAIPNNAPRKTRTTQHKETPTVPTETPGRASGSAAVPQQDTARREPLAPPPIGSTTCSVPDSPHTIIIAVAESLRSLNNLATKSDATTSNSALNSAHIRDICALLRPVSQGLSSQSAGEFVAHVVTMLEGTPLPLVASDVNKMCTILLGAAEMVQLTADNGGGGNATKEMLKKTAEILGRSRRENMSETEPVKKTVQTLGRSRRENKSGTDPVKKTVETLGRSRRDNKPETEPMKKTVQTLGRSRRENKSGTEPVKKTAEILGKSRRENKSGTEPAKKTAETLGRPRRENKPGTEPVKKTARRKNAEQSGDKGVPTRVNTTKVREPDAELTHVSDGVVLEEPAETILAAETARNDDTSQQQTTTSFTPPAQLATEKEPSTPSTCSTRPQQGADVTSVPVILRRHTSSSHLPPCSWRRPSSRVAIIIDERDSFCNVTGCGRSTNGTRVPVQDGLGQAGPRCEGHIATRFCNVLGCTGTVAGFVQEHDRYAAAGVRCWIHGGRRHAR